jgi:hypothetical protein
LRLNYLVLPYPLVCWAERGEFVLEVNGRVQRRARNGMLRVEALTTFGLAAVPNQAGCAHGWWQVENGDEEFYGTDSLAATTPKNLVLGLARAVFNQPARMWDIEKVAARLGYSPRRLQSLLFSQNASFTDIVIKQRLMRTLIYLLECGAPERGDWDTRSLQNWKQLARLFPRQLGVELDTMLRALPARSIAGLIGPTQASPTHSGAMLTLSAGPQRNGNDSLDESHQLVHGASAAKTGMDDWTQFSISHLRERLKV